VDAGSALASAGGADAGAAHTFDHCIDGFDPDPSDDTASDGPLEYTKNGQIDLTVQSNVLTWMQNHVWEAAHFEWHSIRRCVAGTSMSNVNICSYTNLVPADQECKTAGDGLQFLAMNRHMIQSLKQLFPKHIEQFTGFPHFPQSAADVPADWQASWTAFSAQDLANAKIADEIDQPQNLAMFPTEGDFGQWLQCLAPQFSGLHGDLHFHWVRTMNTDHGLGNQQTNIDNYMFWKLHGWIDNVWEKYRTAKGLTDDDPALKDAIATQCHQMDQLALIIDPSQMPPTTTTSDDAGALPPESGEFVTNVRPIFESDTNKCSGCHGPAGAEAGMTLGGNVSGASIVAGLVNKPSTQGGQFKLVAPGDPDHSWLYLKASGNAATAGCMPTSNAICTTDTMPPDSSGQVTVSSAELAALRQWIQDGAPAPTSP